MTDVTGDTALASAASGGATLTVADAAAVKFVPVVSLPVSVTLLVNGCPTLVCSVARSVIVPLPPAASGDARFHRIRVPPATGEVKVGAGVADTKVKPEGRMSSILGFRSPVLPGLLYASVQLTTLPTVNGPWVAGVLLIDAPGDAMTTMLAQSFDENCSPEKSTKVDASEPATNVPVAAENTVALITIGDEPAAIDPGAG